MDYGTSSIIPDVKSNSRRGRYIIVHEDTAKQVISKMDALMDQVIIEYT